MPERDAEDLLLRIAPRIGETAEELASLCGRLPIALRLAGSALAEKEWLTPAEYAGRLANAKERLDLIEASLSTSYDLLREEQQARWRTLAVFPGTFDAAGAAAVWGIEAEPARDELGELVNASLVDYEKGRYSLHDLARIFGDACLTDGERDEAQYRHARHYAGVLRSANELYLQGGDFVLVGLTLFDAEWRNIKAGQAWAAARYAEDQQAAELCSDYPDAGVHYLALRLHPREWIAWLNSGIETARRGMDRAAEGRHLGNLGIACAKLGEPQRAIELYEQVLAITLEIGDRLGEGTTLGNLGDAYLDLGEPRRAIELFEQRLAIARAIGDHRGKANTLGNLGNAYATLGEPRRAIEFYEQRLAMARELGDRLEEGSALGNLGVAYKNLGEPRRAIELYEQHLAIAREIGDRRGEGNTLGNLGNACAALGEPQRAIKHFEQQLAIAREIGDRRGEGITLGNLGVTYEKLGEPRRAVEHYEQHLAIAREIGDRRGEATAAWNLSLSSERERDFSRAADLVQVCVDYERSIGHPDAEKDAAHVAALRARIVGGKGC